MRFLIPLCISIALFVNSNAYCKCQTKPVIVAVIDTGFGYGGNGKEAKLCPVGHKDFTKDPVYGPIPKPYTAEIPEDTNGHGTNIVGIIESYAKPAHTNYCILVLKYYLTGSQHNIYSTIDAFKEAIALGANYINYSSGGNIPSKEEKKQIEIFLDKGGVLAVAAGNEGINLDLPNNNYYPAKYDKRIIVVGMLERNGVQSKVSNYGKVVNRWEIGRDVTGYRVTQSGTSQATATAMGKILAQDKNKCDIGK